MDVARNASAPPPPPSPRSLEALLLLPWPSPSPLPPSPPAPPYSPWAVACLAAAAGALILFTVAGNVLVVLAVLTSAALRAPQHLLLVSLAGADILVAASVVPFSLANELAGAWLLGRAWCRAYLALDVLLCSASIAHLCAISLDRYWSVTRAVEYSRQRTPRRVKGAIALVWLLAAAISSPPLFSGPWEPPPEEEEGGEAPSPPSAPSACRLNDETWYILCSCAGSFFAPCLIMVLVYVRIYRVAKRRTRTLSGRRAPPEAESGPARASRGVAPSQGRPRERGPSSGPRRWEAAELEDVELEESSPSEGRRRPGRDRPAGRAPKRPAASSGGSRHRLSRSLEAFSSRRRKHGSLCQEAAHEAREKRLTFVLAVVLGVFVACWFPFFFSYSLYGICREACQVPDALFKFFFWIGYCNSSLNPVIYTVFNQDFRRSFKHIVFGRRRRRRKGGIKSLPAVGH